MLELCAIEMHICHRTTFEQPIAHSLAWFTRHVLCLESLLNQVTVKRRRNLARPVRRRRSAFRDPAMSLDFLVMAWLGATRLSHIARYLARRHDLAHIFGLPRFADHTTAHNFLNNFHASHLRQLDRVNTELLRHSGSLDMKRPAFLDLDVAIRPVRRRTGGMARVYTWATAFSNHLCVAQLLEENTIEPRDALLRLLEQARALWQGRPRLIRLSPPCLSEPLLRALLRQRFRFLARTSWAWALAHANARLEAAEWQILDPDTRVRDLGWTTLGPASRPNARLILLERASIVPGAPPDRSAVVTSLPDTDPQTLAALASYPTTARSFFGHPTWPLRDGKPPSSRPRGMAAYLRLAAIAMNTLTLFARALGPPWTPGRVHRALRVIPWPSDPPPTST